MKDEQKVFIRGVEGRGDEVIKKLEEHGGKNFDLDGEKPDYLYFINHKGFITFATLDSEFGQIIMDNYTELHLPEMWKDGDVLVTDDGLFFVLKGDFQVDCDNTILGAYCFVSEHQVYLSGHIKQIAHARLASPSEVEHFHELMHKYGKDWDAEKKQVVDWKWEPKEGDDYYYIDNDGDIISDNWDEMPTDADRYNFGNCFRTEEEAEVMAEKVKKLLKGE